MSNESGPESTPRTAPETALAALRTSPANAGSRLGLSPLGVVLVCLFGLGMYLRLHYFGVPSTFQFDEHHFVENARRYIDHQTDLNDHPPLGKLMIAFSMRVLGDTPVGWRAAQLVSGALTVLSGGLAASRLFRSSEAGWLTGALLSADGFFISYSRIALLDGFLATGAVVALLVSALRMNTLTMVLGGACAGVATCIKFSGLGMFPPLVVALALAPLSWPRKASLGVALLSAALVTYVGLYAYGLSIAGQPSSVADVLADTARLWRIHAALTDMKNPATSGWITWILPSRPIVLAYVGQVETVRALTSLGNLAIWWSSVAMGGAVVGLLAWRGFKSALVPAPADRTDSLGLVSFVGEHGRAVLQILAVVGGYLAPWVLTHRDSYIYHFLPCYAGLIVLLGGYLSFVRPRQPFAVLLFMVVVLVVAGVYAPVWSFTPIGVKALRMRLFLNGWR